MIPVIYCKKILNDADTDDYVRKYENLRKNLVYDVEKIN
jgi:hypothetical protein